VCAQRSREPRRVIVVTLGNADPNDQHLAWSPWMMGSSDGWRDESGGRPVVWDNVAARCFGLIASYWPRQIGRMRDDLPFEPLLPCVLDPNDVDQLLDRLRSVHGAPRYDIAPEITKATRAALRLQTAGGGT